MNCTLGDAFKQAGRQTHQCRNKETNTQSHEQKDKQTLNEKQTDKLTTNKANRQPNK